MAQTFTVKALTQLRAIGLQVPKAVALRAERLHEGLLAIDSSMACHPATTASNFLRGRH